MPKLVPEAGGHWGVLGGVFDPIHRGHLQLAIDIANAKNLDGVLFVISLQPPHRSAPCGAPFDDRVRMVERAAAPFRQFAVSTIERDVAGPGYTLNVMRALKDKHPAVAWSLIIGADNLAKFPSWYHAEEILREAAVIAGARPPFDTSGLSWFPKGAVEYVPTSMVDVSSSDIRSLIAQGCTREELSELVTEPVAAYIIEYRLYL